ncbi:hypothetical protein AGMMS49938_14410 [Fibrobacterales bacterium]|nr:hypothetical protein AGMMS49938_14410 [Fibrobacterales bacterium]
MPPLELSGLFFHGSNMSVARIDLSAGISKKDFGKGFYTTNSKIQAEKFAKLKAKRFNAKNGFVSVFEFTHNALTAAEPSLKILRFENTDLDWLNFILFNRGFVKSIHENFSSSNYDIIIGAVADDVVGLVLNQLVIGTYGNPSSLQAKETAVKLLETENLYNQILFRTEKAVKHLAFKESYKVAIN